MSEKILIAIVERDVFGVKAYVARCLNECRNLSP